MEEEKQRKESKKWKRAFLNSNVWLSLAMRTQMNSRNSSPQNQQIWVMSCSCYLSVESPVKSEGRPQKRPHDEEPDAPSAPESSDVSFNVVQESEGQTDRSVKRERPSTSPVLSFSVWQYVCVTSGVLWGLWWIRSLTGTDIGPVCVHSNGPFVCLFVCFLHNKPEKSWRWWANRRHKRWKSRWPCCFHLAAGYKYTGVLTLDHLMHSYFVFWMLETHRRRGHAACCQGRRRPYGGSWSASRHRRMWHVFRIDVWPHRKSNRWGWHV